MKIASKLLFAAGLGAASMHAQQAWFVNQAIGGTRYSVNEPMGQCDGTANTAPVPGAGPNQHCAFADFRSLFQDGSYNANQPFPAYGWLIGTGDIVHVAAGTYRVGWNNGNAALDPKTGLQYGQTGNPFQGAPPPPNGVQIIGAPLDASGHATTHFLGGWGVDSVFDLSGTTGVTLENLDITMLASCGVAGQANSCSSALPLTQDYGKNGVRFSSNGVQPADNVTILNVFVHGMANTGFTGSTQGISKATNVVLVGNGSSGWNMDDGTGNTSSGTLTILKFNISWNGCVEQKGDTTDKLPYADCTDDSSGGYGDGFGTATIANGPSFHLIMDTGIVSYNTQDGLDALHNSGNGSSTTITNVVAYGNMGQQLKAGGNEVNFTKNLAYGNCRAMSAVFPGLPSGGEERLSDFCRAADEAVAISVGNDGTTTLTGNTIASAGATMIDIACGTTCTNDGSDVVTFANNLFIGFPNTSANGYPSGTGLSPNDIYDEMSYNPITSNTGNSEHGTRNCLAANNCMLSPLGGQWQLYGYDATLPIGVPVAVVTVPPPVVIMPVPSIQPLSAAQLAAITAALQSIGK